VWCLTHVLSVAHRLHGRLNAGRAHDFLVSLVMLATECIPEVPQTTAERAPYLGQTLRSKNQKRDHEDEQQMSRLENVADHAQEISWWRPSVAQDSY
jgi:hypothetical protein